MTSVLRSFATNPQMSQTDITLLSPYTLSNSDSQNQIIYNSSDASGVVIIPLHATAKWKSFPIIYFANLSSSVNTKLQIQLTPGVTVRAADNNLLISHIDIRHYINGYLLYVGNDQWVINGVGANSSWGNNA